MHVLVLESNPPERRRISQSLATSGYTVSESVSPAAAMATAQVDLPDVVILDPLFCQGKPWSLISALRGLGVDRRVYVIGSISGSEGSQYTGAWGAGCDDVMRRGAPPDEIRGRVGSLTRILGWVTQAQAAPFDLAGVRSFRELAATTAAELGSMLGETLDIGLPSPVAYVAEHVLSLTAQKLEMSLQVGVDAHGGRQLAQRLLGAVVGAEELRDTLCEIANTLGGAFKRNALVDGHDFALGLPTCTEPFSPEASGRTWGLFGGSMAFSLRAVTRPSRPKGVRALALKEGMVLSQDIRSAQGVLLLPAGTPLTVHRTQRIVELLGGAAMVYVTEPRDGG